MALPKISIVTVVYNGELFLERTIQNVLAQTYPNIEYLLFDGGSKDNTISIIQKYSERIAYWQSEPDKGLYDAMNKSFAHLKGDFVLFMNAGDVFYSSDTLRKIFQGEETADIVYGETMMLDEQYNELGIRSVVTPHKLPESLHWKDFRYGMVVCHQSIFIRTSLAGKYNLAHPYCADIDWILHALKKTNKVRNAHTIVAAFLKGGISDKRMRKSLWDRFNVFWEHFGLFSTIINHIFIVIRAIRFYK